MTTQEINKQFQQIGASEKVGCAINLSWLINQTLVNIRESKVAITKLNLQTSNPLINVGLKLDTASINLTTNGNQVVLSGFNPEIVLRENKASNREYNTVQATFADTRMRIDCDVNNSDRLRFYLLSPQANFTLSSLDANIDLAVIVDNGMTKDTFLRQQELILFTTNLIALLDGFVSSIQFPKILEAMQTFSLQIPYEFTFVQNYVFVTGKNKSTDTACECAGADGFRTNTQLISNLTGPQPNANGFGFQFTRTLTPTTVVTDRLREKPELDNPNFAFYYPLQITFQPFVENVVTPAIAIGDSGSFLAFQWFYKATANLQSGFPVFKIDIAAKTIQVDWPMGLPGGAGASLKIGCVYVPLLHSMVDGDVKPNTITMTLTLTIDGNGVSLYAKPDCIASVNVRFFDSLMIDALLNVLMGSFGNNLISNGLKKAVNKLNFKLFDFTTAEISSPLGWFYNNIFEQDNILVSFTADNG